MCTLNSANNEYDHISTLIKTSLNPSESLLFLGQSTKKESYYALVDDNQGRFNSFRISTHKNNMYYSNKTFSLYEVDKDCFGTGIRSYLDGNCWYKFRFNDYCAMRIIKFLTYKNQPIYIDNTMEIFSRQKMGILFYKLSYIRKNRYEMDTISESLQKALRKLFAAGFINGFKERNGEVRVYITAVGQYVMDKIDAENQEYLDRFIAFKEKSDFYSYIELLEED